MSIVKQTGILIAAFCVFAFAARANRSPETAALLNALKLLGGQYLLLGHQDAAANDFREFYRLPTVLFGDKLSEFPIYQPKKR